MDIICTLTIKDDETAEYEDNLLHRRDENETVSGELGGASHVRETIKLLNRLVAKEGPPCTRYELKILGSHLYDVAFGAEGCKLRAAFERTYRRFDPESAKERFRLRLVIAQGTKELSGFPWEFLFMPGNQGFFLAGEKTELILTRYVPNPPSEAVELEPDGALRILIVVSQPQAPGLATVEAGKLIKDVESLQDASDEKIQVLRCDSPTRSQLDAQVREHKPHVIHFVGHGQPGQIALRKTEEQIRLARAEMETRSATGQPVPDIVDEADWADATSMRGFLHAALEDPASPRRLFFLHACHGASPIDSENALLSFRSLAQELADGPKVAAVVAMQYAISNTDAQSFAREFYAQMREGCEVDEAVSLARRKLGSAPEGLGRQSWNDRGFGTPVIYLRDERPLFRPPLPTAPQPQPAGHEAVQPVPPAKEPCPNPFCNALVIRGHPPCKAPSCGMSFEDCPAPNCSGLVVAQPGYLCSASGHEYRAAGGMTGRHGPGAAAETSSRATSTPAEPGLMPPPRRSGQLGAPTKPPELEGGNGNRPA